LLSLLQKLVAQGSIANDIIYRRIDPLFMQGADPQYSMLWQEIKKKIEISSLLIEFPVVSV